METRKLNFSKVLGIGIGLIAIVMFIIDLLYANINFDTTMLVVVMGIATILLAQKSKPTGEEIKLSSKQQAIVLSVLSVGIVAGIIAFIFTVQ